MQIRFLGPLGKVTGSCAWMRDDTRGWNFLVDCGMQQSESTAEHWNSGEEWPFFPHDLQFVILTHAHIDHCGLIPELYKRGFAGPVYCTAETAELADLQLRDAAKMKTSPFDEADVGRIHFRVPGRRGKTEFGHYHPIAEDLFIRFFRSGHLLGAASVTVLWGPPKTSSQRGIVFSGDIGPGREDEEVRPFERHLHYPRPETFAVVESTYGGSVRTDEEMNPVNRRQRLVSALDRAMERGGTLAIPAFGAGRTQDILFDIHFVVANDPTRYEGMNYLLDSPSAEKVNAVTLRALHKTERIGNRGKVRPLWLGKQVFRDLDLDKRDPDHQDHACSICEMALTMNQAAASPADAPGNNISRQWRSLFRSVSDRETEIHKASNGPTVVVMSSGMCDGGPAASWLPALLTSDKNEVALSGYCAHGSIGNELQELAPIPYSERQMLRNELRWAPNGQSDTTVRQRDIKADISILSGYSAHADQEELVNWIIHESPHERGIQQAMANQVFLQHGTDHARKALANAIQEKASKHGLAVETALPSDSTAWIDLEPSGARVSATPVSV